MKTYFALIGNSSAASNRRWSVTSYNSETDIIGFAEAECNKSGEQLCELAGISMIGVNPDKDGDCKTFEPSRPFNDVELFQTALAKLNDDSRTYRIFDDSDAAAVAEFINVSDCVGLGERSKALVAKFCNPSLWPTPELLNEVNTANQ